MRVDNNKNSGYFHRQEAKDAKSIGGNKMRKKERYFQSLKMSPHKILFTHAKTFNLIMEKPGIHHLKPAMKQTSLTKRHICITSFTCLPQMHNLNLVVEKCETNSNGKRFYERTSPYFLQGHEGQIRKLPRLEETKSDMRDKYNVESWMDPGARKKKKIGKIKANLALGL